MSKAHIEKLYKNQFSYYVKVMSQKSGNSHDAEDIVQEAFYRALFFSHKWNEDKGELKTWFNAILNNCLYDWNTKRMDTTDSDYEEESQELDDFFEPVFMARDLSNLIDSVTNPEHKDILYLSMIEGMKDKDVAVGVGCSHEKVRKTKHDFKKRVRE